MYIQRRLGLDGEILDSKTFGRKELADHVKPIDWASKGIILAGLMVKMFEGLGLHNINFHSVMGKFNSDMMFKSLMFIGKPLKMHVLSGNLNALLIDY